MNLATFGFLNAFGAPGQDGTEVRTLGCDRVTYSAAGFAKCPVSEEAPDGASCWGGSVVMRLKM